MCQVTIVYQSTGGVTKSMAGQVHKGAASVEGVTAEIIDVIKIDRAGWDKLNASDALIFGAPTYFGSASAAFKSFMDASTDIWGEQLWLDKLAAGFTTSGAPCGDKLQTLTQLMIFAAQHGMHWINLGKLAGHSLDVHDPENLNRLGSWLGAMAQPCHPREDGVIVPGADAATARFLGKRVAKVCLQFNGRTTTST